MNVGMEWNRLERSGKKKLKTNKGISEVLKKGKLQEESNG